MSRTRGTGVVVSLQREDVPRRGLSATASRDADLADRSNGHETGSILALAKGQVAALSGLPGSGLTRIGLSLLAPHAARGALAVVDVRGWASPQAAWELGIEPEHLIVVRNGDLVTWSRVVATLLDGAQAVYAEIPNGVKDAVLRKLAGKARTRRIPLALRPVAGDLPGGIAHLHLRARAVIWDGAESGHGRLRTRRTIFDASGKSTRGMERTIEVEDDGTNDLRVVPHMDARTTRYLA
ncbi:MAG: hypothetical protein R2823_06815 [Acidimicrobiia bacterium]